MFVLERRSYNINLFSIPFPNQPDQVLPKFVFGEFLQTCIQLTESLVWVSHSCHQRRFHTFPTEAFIDFGPIEEIFL